MNIPNKFAAHVFLALTPLCSYSAENVGWHLGDPIPERAAPAAIGTIQIAPGPHQVVVAVIDSGVFVSHPSLEGSLLAGYDMISNESNIRGSRSSNAAPDDRDAKCGNKLVSSTFRTHGTEVASLISANGRDGMAGVNPNAKVVPIRVFGACGMNISDMIDALNWAAGFKIPNLPVNPNPARIINISISGGNKNCSAQLQQTIDRIIAKNIFVVVAAGNNFNKPLNEPANCNGVISVGSVSADNRVERHSALDSRTVIYAPGGGTRIKSDQAWALNRIRIASYESNAFGQERAVVKDTGVGTSYAAPIVSGYLSLWLSYFPNKTPKDWFAEMDKHKRPVGPIDACSLCVPTSLAADANSLGFLQ